MIRIPEYQMEKIRYQRIRYGWVGETFESDGLLSDNLQLMF